MTASVTPLPFKGDLIDYLELNGRKLEWLWRDHEAYIPVRPICEQLDLAYQPQHRKLTGPESEAVVTMMVTPGADGKRYEMLCIAYPDFLIWLATLTISKVKPQAQDALRRTKAEIKQVLSTYYRERLLGEAAQHRKADAGFISFWLGMRRHHPTIMAVSQAGGSFSEIMQTTSVPAWKVAAHVRDAYHLGVIDKLPSALPAPRVVLTPMPAKDPRQMPLFGEA